jgi:UTP--glucose-1-phosphate uridylyltransferase
VVAVQEVLPEEISLYGCVEPDGDATGGVVKIRRIIEKPPREEAPSNLAIIGRYILTPDIFPELEETARVKDRTGEIQLTNGLRRLLKKRPIYGCRIDGVRHDTGNKLGFLKAVVYFALKRNDLAQPFKDYLGELGLNVPAASKR